MLMPGMDAPHARSTRLPACHAMLRPQDRRAASRFRAAVLVIYRCGMGLEDEPDSRPPDLVIRARNVITPGATGPGAVVIRDGVIAAVQRPDWPGVAARAVDLAADEVLLPGLVDTHVHVNEPGRTDWEGFACATRAAAAGGITTIIDMPLNSIPPTVDVPALDAKRAAAAGQCHVDVGFWGGSVPGNLGDLAPLHEAGVFGFKSFTIDSGVPEFPPLRYAGLERSMREVAALGGVQLVHAEDPDVIAAAPRASGPSYAGFLASRPDAAEVAAISRVISLARETGARAHVLHLSSAAAVEPLRAARAAGVPVTVETCPHYLALAAEDVPDGATQYKCCPPVRGRANAAALWDALRTGVIDCVVSDHSPCPPPLKRVDHGDFGAAWGGICSAQLSLAVMFTEAERVGLALADLAGLMSLHPARMAGLRGKGAIAPGFDADLVAFAPEDTFRVEPAMLAHRHKLTPYAGRWLRGAVRRTWLRGEIVDGARPRGRLLRRGEPASVRPATRAAGP
jgi:allantoinase